MSTQWQVAQFIRGKIQTVGKSQKEIAEQAGFENPNMITMLKQGKTKLPLAKVGPMAVALGADPVHLLRLCLSTYQPETWAAIAPLLVSALTRDELCLLNAVRAETGGPQFSSLSDESKEHLDKLMRALRAPAHVH